MSWGVVVLGAVVYLPLATWLFWVWRSGRWPDPARGGEVKPYEPKHRRLRFHVCDTPYGPGRYGTETPEPWRCPVCGQVWEWDDEWVPDIVDAWGLCDIGGPVGWVRRSPLVRS